MRYSKANIAHTIDIKKANVPNVFAVNRRPIPTPHNIAMNKMK